MLIFSFRQMARVIIIKYDKIIVKWKTNIIKIITTFSLGNNGVISVLSTGTRWCHDSHHRFLKASRSSPPSNRSVKVTHVQHYRCWANTDNISSQVLIESSLHWTLIPTIISLYYHFLPWSSWKLSRNKNTTFRWAWRKTNLYEELFLLAWAAGLDGWPKLRFDSQKHEKWSFI